MKRNSTAVKHEPVPSANRPWCGLHLETEGVPDTVRSANHRHPGRAIIERAPELLDETNQSRIRHVGAGPQPLVQFPLAHHARSRVDQQEQQIEGLGREVDGHAITQEMAAVGVKREGSEFDHGHPRNPLERPRFGPDFEHHVRAESESA